MKPPLFDGARGAVLKSIALGVALAACALFSGCAFGRRHAYNSGALELDYRGSGLVAVAVHDQRPLVVKRVKDPEFVGLSRGGFGNPFDIKTQSGRPLAIDVADTIMRALVASNHRVTYVATTPDQSTRWVISNLMRTGAPRLLLVQIDEWASDTMNNTALVYDISAKVLDSDGQRIAGSNVDGRASLGGRFLGPADHAEEAVPRAYIKRLTRLLNRPDIGRALEAPAPESPDTAPSDDVAPSEPPQGTSDEP